MKKILYTIILFIFVLAGCNDESVVNHEDEMGANGEVDMDGDGNEEIIKVTLLEGEKTKENKYKWRGKKHELLWCVWNAVTCGI